MKSEQEQRQKFLNATERIKEIQNIYRPHRKYKRKDAGPEDEQTRVRITLLEYGNKGKDILPKHLKADGGTKSSPNATSKRTEENSNDTQRNDSVSHGCKVAIFFKAYNYYMFCVLFIALQIDIDQLLKTLYVANEVMTTF